MGDWFEKMTYGSVLDSAVDRFAGREALQFRGQRWTFEQLGYEVDKVAKALIANGVVPGDRVAVWMLNRPEWIFSQFAVAKVGAVLLPVNTSLRAADLQFVLRHSGASTLIMAGQSGPVSYIGILESICPEIHGADPNQLVLRALPDLRRVVVTDRVSPSGAVSWESFVANSTRISADDLAGQAARVDPDGLASIMYTSGTTGTPKGVMHSHHTLRNVIDEANRLNVRESDVILTYLPLFHAFALYDGPLLSVVTGARQVLIERFEPGEVLTALERERATLCFGFATHFQDLMDHDSFKSTDRSSLRAGILAVGPKSMEAIAYRVQRQFGGKIVSGYGMTEIGVGATLGFLDEDADHSACTSGYPLPGYEIRIVDREAGEECVRGETGEILVRSYQMTMGYYDNPGATEESIDAAGWLHTGDMGVRLSDGYLRVLGRYKDMLRVGAENVDPAEVEAIYASYPEVAQSAVVGVPDERLGEVPCLYVVLNNSDDKSQELAAALLEFASGRVAAFKRPRYVLFTRSLPITPTGKLQRHLLRDQAVAELAAEPTDANVPSVKRLVVGPK